MTRGNNQRSIKLNDKRFIIVGNTYISIQYPILFMEQHLQFT